MSDVLMVKPNRCEKKSIVTVKRNPSHAFFKFQHKLSCLTFTLSLTLRVVCIIELEVSCVWVGNPKKKNGRRASRRSMQQTVYTNCVTG